MLIQNCFIKVHFAPLTLEENLKNPTEFNNNSEGIWDRLQAAGLVPKDFNFNECEDGDEDLIARKTITKSSEIDDPGASKHTKEDQKMTTMKTILWMKQNLLLFPH